jgi:hypothetical protein
MTLLDYIEIAIGAAIIAFVIFFAWSLGWFNKE